MKKVKKEETVDKGVEVLATIANDKDQTKWVAFYAKKAIKEIANMYEDSITTNTEKIKKYYFIMFFWRYRNFFKNYGSLLAYFIINFFVPTS